MWNCTCKCGKSAICHSYNLTNKNSNSCGCSRLKIPKGTAAYRSIVRSYKDGAHKRGYSFELEDAQLQELFKANCHYCGKPPSNVKGPTTKARIFGSYTYSGIDRKDNTQGYTPENCVPCCGLCNRAKSDMSYQDFIAWATQISNTRGAHP